MISVTPHAIMLCYTMLCFAMFCKGAIPELSFLASLINPMDMMNGWPWFIPSRDNSRIPLLLMGIHYISLTTGLPMTMTITITITTALIATA